MARLRLLVADGNQVTERVFTRFPVRIGRLGDNDCQILDTSVSKTHAQLELDGDTLVLRDLRSTNGTVMIGEPWRAASIDDGAGRRLREESARLQPWGGFFVGAVRVYARLEHEELDELPGDVIRALRKSSADLLKACAPPAVPTHAGGGPELARVILDALFRSLFSLRSALGGASDAGSYRDPVERTESIASLITWAQTVSQALRVLERTHREDAELRSCRDTSDDGPLLESGG